MDSRFLSPYYFFNAILLAAYAGAKLYHDKHGKTPYSMLNENTFPSWEQQCRYSLIGIAFIKYYRHKSWDHYLAEVFWYGKIVTSIVLFFVDLRLLAWFVLLSWMSYALLPQPELRSYDDDKLSYITPIKLKKEVLDSSCKTPWLVAFYSPSNPDCIHAMPLLVQTANKYASEHLKFGIIDVSVFRRTAAELRIDTSVVSKELPALILFEKGKEQGRMLNRGQGWFPGAGIRSVKDIARAFSLEQRSKGEALETSSKKKR